MSVPALLAGLAVTGVLAWRFRRLGTAGRLALAVVATLLLLTGAGVVELPDAEALVTGAGETLGNWTYLVVAVFAFVEGGALVGLLVPGETIVIFTGVIAGQGVIDPYLAFVLAWVMAVAGDHVGLLLGRRFGRAALLRHAGTLRLDEDRIAKVERFFERRGGTAILLGRFVSLVRSVLPFVAGASGMRLRRFTPYDVVGAGLWAALCIGLGVAFWESFDQAVRLAGQGTAVLVTLALLVLGTLALLRLRREPERRRALRARLDRLAERPAARPLVRALLAAERRSRRPRRFVHDRLTPGDLGLELTTLVALAGACGGTFLALERLLDQDRFLALDVDVLDALDRARTGLLVDVAEALSVLGSGPVVVTVAAAALGLLVARRAFLEAATLLTGAVVATAAVLLEKAVEDRPRPPGSLVEVTGSGFPSGHGALGVGLVVAAVALRHLTARRRLRVLLVVAAVTLAVAVALARLMLRTQYVSDVLAGWALAGAVFAVCGLVVVLVAALRHDPPPA